VLFSTDTRSHYHQLFFSLLKNNDPEIFSGVDDTDGVNLYSNGDVVDGTDVCRN